MVKNGRHEELMYMIDKLQMFEFGDERQAWAQGGKRPTTTKWVEGPKVGEDGKAFARCRLVARDFKPQREGPRDDLFAAMPPLEAKRALFALAAGERRRMRAQGLREEKVLLLGLKKAHLSAKCEEEEWVELPGDFWNWGK